MRLPVAVDAFLCEIVRRLYAENHKQGNGKKARFIAARKSLKNVYDFVRVRFSKSLFLPSQRVLLAPTVFLLESHGWSTKQNTILERVRRGPSRSPSFPFLSVSLKVPLKSGARPTPMHAGVFAPITMWEKKKDAVDEDRVKEKGCFA